MGKNQHYVPRFYMRGFMPEGVEDKIYRMGKKDLDIMKDNSGSNLISLATLGTEKNTYKTKFDEYLETSFDNEVITKFEEEKMKKLLHVLKKVKEGDELTKNIYDYISEVVRFQYTRTKSFRETIVQNSDSEIMGEFIVDELENWGLSDDKETHKKEYKDLSKKEKHIIHIISGHPNINSAMDKIKEGKCSIRLLVSDSNDFITTTDPVIHDVLESGYEKGMVGLPISKNRYLEVYVGEEGKGEFYFDEVKRKEVNYVNMRTFLCSISGVILSSDIRSLKRFKRYAKEFSDRCGYLDHQIRMGYRTFEEARREYEAGEYKYKELIIKYLIMRGKVESYR